MNVLVIEDDSIVQYALLRGLQAEGYVVTAVGTGAEGRARLAGGAFDALVTDLSLPDMDGVELAQRLRREGSRIPILMLTARDTLDERLQGFAAGADDYLTKPFAMSELLARLAALIRRATPAQFDHALTLDDVVLDRKARQVYRGGQLVHLTPKDYAVLEFLMEHIGEVLSREAIMRRVWSYDFDGQSNVVETSIKRIRLALDRGHEHSLVHTAHSSGYMVKLLDEKSRPLTDPDRIRRP